jgi:hypothetical protein
VTGGGARHRGDIADAAQEPRRAGGNAGSAFPRGSPWLIFAA